MRNKLRQEQVGIAKLIRGSIDALISQVVSGERKRDNSRTES